MSENVLVKIPRDNFRIAWLSLFGILGLIVGTVILFRGQLFGSSKSTFHEILYSPRQVADTIILRAADSLETVIATRRANILELQKKEKKDSQDIEKLNEFTSWNKKDTSTLVTLRLYTLVHNDISDADSSGFAKLNQVLHFEITPQTIQHWDTIRNALSRTKKDSWSDTIRCSFKHINVPFPLYGTAKFRIAPASSTSRFIAKYPALGMWILLLLVFSSFCFIVISTCIYLFGKINRLFSEQQSAPTKNLYWLFSILSFVILMFLAWLGLKTYNDEYVIKNLYFMDSLIGSMKGMIVIGYVAGSLCLAGFLYTAGMLGFISNEIRQFKLQPASEQTKEKENLQQAKYSSLKKVFDTYFVLSAIILSLLGLCTGGLFSTVNSLDFVKLLADDWGYSPARPDFIYLYGGFHTIILLLVYIPAKVRFNEITVDPPTALTETKTTVDSGWKKFLKGPMGQLGEIFIASSPLLVSLVQALIDSVFN